MPEPVKEEGIYVNSLAKALLKARDRADLQKTPDYLTNGANLLKKVYGVDMAAFIARQDDTRRFKKWVKGEDLPAEFEAFGLIAAIEITEILLGKLSHVRAKEWMTTPCSYILDNLPMDFIREDEALVRRAALQVFLKA